MDRRRAPHTGPTRALACYLFAGATTLAVRVAGVVPMDRDTAGRVGLVFLAPLCLAALPALAVALVDTLRLRRDPLLIALAVLTVLFLASVVSEAFPPAIYNASGWIYGVGAPALALWGLTRRRRRAR